MTKRGRTDRTSEEIDKPLFPAKTPIRAKPDGLTPVALRAKRPLTAPSRPSSSRLAGFPKNTETRGMGTVERPAGPSGEVPRPSRPSCLRGNPSVPFFVLRGGSAAPTLLYRDLTEPNPPSQSPKKRLSKTLFTPLLRPYKGPPWTTIRVDPRPL